MIFPGLVSVTFRALAARDVVLLAKEAGLSWIEWGGDVHVPVGRLDVAREVGDHTRQEGLEVVSYGSYYRAGTNGTFEDVVKTAAALGAPSIRVWAGLVGSSGATPDDYRAVVDDLHRICGLALEEGLRIALEFHPGTLTDTAASAIRLVGETNSPNLRLYWQPDPNAAVAERLESLVQVGPYLSHLHVFQWERFVDKTVRKPLAEGANEWVQYLAQTHEMPGDRYALLEFVESDSPEQFLADASTLIGWLDRFPVI